MTACIALSVPLQLKLQHGSSILEAPASMQMDVGLNACRDHSSRANNLSPSLARLIDMFASRHRQSNARASLTRLARSLPIRRKSTGDEGAAWLLLAGAAGQTGWPCQATTTTRRRYSVAAEKLR